ncbi:UNVERIFIED_CONTAM: hypothetical protein Slati_1328900 [Sesamum latifolium]|uniref:Uncharacterized protein n=1 Tax=Sesamum latifolium TaxID=2727402 RepID=A0AAW2XHP7_9LAMI
MISKEPWSAIVSNVRIPIAKIKEQYHIPHDYEVIIPRQFDRMHRPPQGFCPFSLLHLEAGLRFPLARPVDSILRRLDICPMQLSPNSISHIQLFIIVMLHNDLEPNFENFWSLYSFTNSKRSQDRGWFYLSTRKDYRYLDDLKSNVGPWRERFIFIRPPPGKEWSFRLSWRITKSEPKLYGGGLEGDLINYITLYWYKPKQLLVEEVLRLAGLSSAPLRVWGSLGDFLILNLQFVLKYILHLMYSFAGKKVMNAHIANKVRARKGTLPENVLLELENATGDSSTPSDRTPPPATSTPVVAALEGPSGENLLEVSETLPQQVGALEAVQGEPSRPSKKRKHKSKSRSKSRSKSKSRSSRSSKFGKQRRLEARLAANREKEDDHVKTLEEQEAQ